MAETFLDSLDERATAALRERSIRRSWLAGAALFHEGERAYQVIVIETGVVKAVAVSETGIEVALAIRGPGQLLGELAAVSGGRRSATVTTLEPVTALVTPVESFREFLRGDADASFALLEVMANRMREAGQRQVEFGSLETSVRLARLLAELATVYGSQSVDGVHLRLVSQDELASLCSASREAVARGLRLLRDAGLVETGRREVKIPDIDALSRWTAQS